MSFEDILSQLAPAAAAAAPILPPGAFSPTAELNPINLLILAVFGENFYPPYTTQFQPEDKGKLATEALLQLAFPGGGKIRPTGDSNHTGIPDLITPITGIMSSIFSFFGPLFLILDVIRAIIDVICSLFNPVPLIATVVDLFLTVLPPLIALFPPFATILLVLNTIKVIIAITVSIIAYLIPIIEQIVDNANKISAALESGNFLAAEGIQAKISALLQYLLNVLNGFVPIQFIIDIVTYFMSLSSSFVCVKPDSPCCTAENCPPVIINPPAGTAVVMKDQNRFSLLDLLDLALAIITVPLGWISELIEKIYNFIVEPLEDILNASLNIIAGIIEGIAGFFNNVVSAVASLFDLEAPDLTVDFETANLQLPPADFNLPTKFSDFIDAGFLGDVGQSFAEFLDSVVLIRPETEIKFRMTGRNKVISQENRNGLLSEFGVGHVYTLNQLKELQKYIVDPKTISEGQDVKDPHTLKVKLRRLSDNKEVTATVIVPPKDLLGRFIVTNADGSTFTAEEFPANRLIMETDAFNDNDIVSFSVIPNEETLLKLNLIGLGCHSDVASASSGLTSYINADARAIAAARPDGAAAAIGGAQAPFSGFSALKDKIGRDFPLPPLNALLEAYNKQASDPSKNNSKLFTDILGDYLQQATDFYDSLLCVGSSGIQAKFTISKNYIIADGQDFATLSFGIRDIGGNNLLLGLVATSSAKAVFITTKGKIGPVIYNNELSEYQATFTSDSEGPAEITAEFLINGKVCTTPLNFDGFTTSGKVLKVEFLPKFGPSSVDGAGGAGANNAGTTPRRRQDRQYVQSKGGRRR